MNTKECQFCCSQIPGKATKCKYCLEWQEEVTLKETESSSEKLMTFSDRFPTLRSLFQLRIVEKIPFHYVVSILIIGAIFFAAIQFLWYRLDEDKIYLLSFLFAVAQMVFSWSGMIWAYKAINDNYLSFVQISKLSQKDAEMAFVTHHNRIFNYTNCILVGLVVGTVAVIGDHMVGTPFATFEAKVIWAAFEFINMFFAGAGIYSMLMYAIFVHKMSEDSDEDSQRLDRSDCIINIGKVHLKTCVVGIGPLFLGVIVRLFGSWSWELRIVLWYGMFAIAIIVYIYWPMLNIHKLMQQDVKRQTSLIQKKLQEILLDIKTSQSIRNVIRLNELRELEKSISKESTWPFDPKNISAVFSAIGFPIMLMIIDKIWSI